MVVGGSARGGAGGAAKPRSRSARGELARVIRALQARAGDLVGDDETHALGGGRGARETWLRERVRDIADALQAQPADARAEGARVRGLRLQRVCLLYTSPSPRDGLLSRMPSSA